MFYPRLQNIEMKRNSHYVAKCLMFTLNHYRNESLTNFISVFIFYCLHIPHYFNTLLSNHAAATGSSSITKVKQGWRIGWKHFVL